MDEDIQTRKEDFEERQLVTFYIGNDEFGSDIMHVREIIRLAEVTKVPQAPGYVEGVCNLRGNILPIIDGRTRLGLERRQKDENTRVLVVDVHGKSTGIVVDRMSEVLRVNQSDIEDAPQIVQGTDSNYIEGMVKLNEGKRIITALNISNIITTEKIEEIKQAGKSTIVKADSKEKTTDIEEEQLVTFLLGDEEYAFSIMDVKEIIRVEQITAIPNVPKYVEGVIAIRNRLLPIINMRSFFELPAVEPTDQARIIIVDLGKITAGFWVDKVAEVISIPKKIIDPPPAVFHTDEIGQIRGVAKLNDGKRLIMCLNATKLLSTEIIEEVIGGRQEGTVSDEESTDKGSVISEEQLVAFRIAGEEYAVKITDVQEINRMSEVTHMPGAPSYIDGLVNLRGNVIPALNLRRRFDLPEHERNDATRIIIVDTGNRKTGIVVDAVSEVLRFDRSLVEDTPEIVSTSVDTRYISGVGKLDNGNRMVMILELSQVLCIEMSK